MPLPLLSTMAAQDAIVVEIARLAARYARKLVTRDLAEDVAQDVVLECLMKLRARRWSTERAALPGLVRHMVRRRAMDTMRGIGRRAERDAEHARELSESLHGWMAPDVVIDVCELAAVHAEALASLPPRCRRIYMMVREERITYEVVAKR